MNTLTNVWQRTGDVAAGRRGMAWAFREISGTGSGPAALCGVPAEDKAADMDDVKLEWAGSEESVPGGQRPGAAAECGGAGLGVQSVSRVWIAGVAREVIRQLAPEELEEPAVFDVMADGWLSGEMPRPRPRRRPGAAVGFGIDAVLLSELVFPILTDQRVTPSEVSTGTAGASTAGASPGEVVQPIGQQMHDLHDACRRHAMTLGLPPDTAVLLADAVVGALRSAPGGP